MGMFINPFTDVGFKRIFGQEISKPLIIDFLNSLLEGERKIVNLTFLDKEFPAATVICFNQLAKHLSMKEG